VISDGLQKRSAKVTETLSCADAAQEPRDPGLAAAEGVGNAAARLLEVSGYAALRQLQCEIIESTVIVRGFLPSYYLKQMAQTILQRLDGISTVMNLVEVRADNRPLPK